MSKDNPQDYRGNGGHDWELVIYRSGGDQIIDDTSRLRVPGGWLYRNWAVGLVNGKDKGFVTMTFVPMPEVVKHKV
jgi:hypothetical protein